MSHTLQSALESRQEARIVQIDFSSAFDRVNHQGILYKLSSVGIGSSVLSVLTQFISNRSQFWITGSLRIAIFGYGSMLLPLYSNLFPSGQCLI